MKKLLVFTLKHLNSIVLIVVIIILLFRTGCNNPVPSSPEVQVYRDTVKTVDIQYITRSDTTTQYIRDTLILRLDRNDIVDNDTIINNTYIASGTINTDSTSSYYYVEALDSILVLEFSTKYDCPTITITNTDSILITNNKTETVTIIKKKDRKMHFFSGAGIGWNIKQNKPELEIELGLQLKNRSMFSVKFEAVDQSVLLSYKRVF